MFMVLDTLRYIYRTETLVFCYIPITRCIESFFASSYGFRIYTFQELCIALDYIFFILKRFFLMVVKFICVIHITIYEFLIR